MEAQTDDENLAIPFINFTTKFEVDPRAVEYLSSFKEKLGLVAIWGKYRTGKSYLLNRLMQQKSEEWPEEMKKVIDSLPSVGFNVGSTINPCTKGLWLLKKPIYVKDPDQAGKVMPVLIIDTEGLGAFDENENHDTKIFMLALLICSMLVYNSVGTIDESALNNLSLVVNLSKTLQCKNGGGDSDMDELAKHFPAFLWVLRDFSLKLVDQFNNHITPKTYLENSLEEHKGTSDQIANKNRIRRLIRHFFEDRDCSTLIRPMEEEAGLQNLNNISDSEIRPDFLEQLKKLRGKVFKRVKPKSLNGQLLNGPMVAELAKAYVESLNLGKTPTIESAWDYMCTEENQKALKLASTHIQSETDKLAKALPIDSTDLFNHKSQILNKSQDIFSNNILSGMAKDDEKEFQAKLAKFCDDSFKNLEKLNNCASTEVVQKFFEKNFKDIVRQNLRNDKYECYEDYEKDLDEFKDEFKTKVKGDHFEKYLEIILVKFNERIFKDISAVKTRRLELELTAYKERMKRAEQELASGKEYLQKDKDRLSTRIEELEADRIEKHSRVEILSEKLKFMEKDKDQKVQMWEEKWEKLERQLEEKDREVKKLQDKLEKWNDTMFERQSDLMRSSQQFMMAKDNIDTENVAIKKNLENAQSQVEKLRSEMQMKNEQIVELKTKEELVNSILEKGTVKNDEEIKRLVEENTLLRDKNAKLKEEYDELHEKYKTAVNQHDENKGVLESLLAAVKSKMNKKERERSSLVEINKHLNTLMQKQDEKNIELENNVDVLRKYKQTVKSAHAVQCKGCMKTYPIALFSSHVKLWPKLEHNGLRLEVQEWYIDRENHDDDPKYFYKILVTFAGDIWTEKSTYRDFYKFHKVLKSAFQNEDFLSEYDFECLNKANDLSGSQKSELSEKRLEFLKQYSEDLNSFYCWNTEYVKIVFDCNIWKEESMNQQTSTMLLNILKSKPSASHPSNAPLDNLRDKGKALENGKCISFLSMNRSTRKENYPPRYS